jgi:glycosyltransferase involved in cell wall biosynthesis
VIWDCVDCISHLFSQACEKSRSLKGRWMTRLELPRTRPFEGWLTTQFDHTLTTSDIDGEALRKLADQQWAVTHSRVSQPHWSPEISVLPNGVDLDYFKPPVEMRDPATLVFAGKISYHANVTAALHLIHEIMPRVWRHRPDVKVVIAGKDPPPSLLRLASSSNTHSANSRHFPPVNGEAIRVTGSVPDLRPYLHRATISVAPLLYGAGIQNKVLEAMACATPVIASPRAVAALSVQVGRDLLVAGDAEVFAQEILALLADSSRRSAIGLAGRAYVEAHHDWRQIGSLLESAYRQVIAAVREDGSCPASPFKGMEILSV